uniref:hypothetical protein n=1 Tax=Klebsiella aerogenes TaxID=548 RepID=UPI003A97C3B8
PLPYPLYARLLPRLACALNRPLFVQFVQTAQAPPVLALRSKNIVSKIVQICAISCVHEKQKKEAYQASSCVPLNEGLTPVFSGNKRRG